MISVQQKGLQDVFIHAFTDGRDCDPKSGLGFMKELQKHITKISWVKLPLLVAAIMQWTVITVGNVLNWPMMLWLMEME